MSGLSYEIIVLIKIIVYLAISSITFFYYYSHSFIFYLILKSIKLKIIFLSFLIGSPIITCIASISGSMNLLNNKNFAIGSLIIMILSIPAIIFSVSLVNGSSEKLINPQINIFRNYVFFLSNYSLGMCNLY